MADRSDLDGLTADTELLTRLQHEALDPEFLASCWGDEESIRAAAIRMEESSGLEGGLAWIELALLIFGPERGGELIAAWYVALAAYLDEKCDDDILRAKVKAHAAADLPFGYLIGEAMGRTPPYRVARQQMHATLTVAGSRFATCAPRVPMRQRVRSRPRSQRRAAARRAAGIRAGQDPGEGDPEPPSDFTLQRFRELVGHHPGHVHLERFLLLP